MSSLLKFFGFNSEHEDRDEASLFDLEEMEEGCSYGSMTIAMPNKEASSITSDSTPNSIDLDMDSLEACPQTWILPSRHASLDLESVFSTVRSTEEFEQVAQTNESEAYRHSSAFQRAAPERLFALTITLLLEIPVLMMVSGGSDALCGLLGRSRYQLLVGFLPLTSAISGNVGLQASTLTTRAISHSHVTIEDYWLWLTTEIAAAVYLGLGMGSIMGSLAFVASGFDWAFGITIGLAQLLSIVTAGLTGTIAPLLFSFLFQRDSGKWGGPLETAIQDIVGSFAMVIVSYHILRLLGPGTIDPMDTCGLALASSM